MIGLLEKARKLRISFRGGEEREEFAYDPESGISREDQKEILKEIESVATGSRITVTPEVFAVKAARRGILFPVVVNAAAVFVLLGGLGTLYFLFQRGETRLVKEQPGTITAEGKLIEELKKDSEAKLLAKNQQISQIQGRLADIEKQRQDLQANMDAKVRDREAQLRAALAADLEAERARLQTQGLSDQDIAKRLADLEAKKNAESLTQLDVFRAEAEADRKKSEASLQALAVEYNASLAKANDERQKVLDDSRKREADLQAQLAQKTREVESAKAQAEAALKSLQSQKEKEDMVAGQLVGLYAVVKSDISARSYPKALASLQAIRDYVTSADVAVLPGLAKRREIDLFIVDSLAGLVQGEIDKSTVDTASLVDAANNIAEVRAKVKEGDALARTGRLAEAEKAYGDALAIIPEIAKVNDYFTKRGKEAESARLEALNAGLSRAESLFLAGRYDDMLAAYKDAFAYLPEPPARIGKTLENLSTAPSTRDAAYLLKQGNALLRQEKLDEAIAQYMTVAAKYPQSPQADAAVQGIADAVKRMNDAAAEMLATREKQLNGALVDLNGTLADMNVTLAAQAAEIEAGRQKIADLGSASGDLAQARKDLAHAREDLAAALEKSGNAEKQAAALNEKIAALTTQLEEARAHAGDTAAQKDLQDTLAAAQSALNRIQSTVTQTRSSFGTYAAREDALLADRGKAGLVASQTPLNEFLGSIDELLGTRDRSASPLTLYERVNRINTAYQEAGAQTALQDMTDIVSGLGGAGLDTAAKKRAFLEKQKNRYAADKDVSAFIDELSAVLGP